MFQIDQKESEALQKVLRGIEIRLMMKMEKEEIGAVDARKRAVIVVKSLEVSVVVRLGRVREAR